MHHNAIEIRDKPYYNSEILRESLNEMYYNLFTLYVRNIKNILQIIFLHYFQLSYKKPKPSLPFKQRCQQSNIEKE